MAFRIAAALMVVGWVGSSSLAQQQTPRVQVSAKDPRYFQTSDGKPYIPNGMNLVYPPYVKGNDPQQRLAELDQWLEKLAKNGGNHIRVWLSNDFYEVEHQKAGQYDAEKAAARIDPMLQIARKHGIYVKMTIEHFREVDLAGARQPWATKPLHHTSKGGLAQTMEQWVASPEARKQFVAKLEFFSRRYKDEPAIYGWELWNEMNAIRKGDYMDWTSAMLPELHRLFPNTLCMQSLGSFDTDGVRKNYLAVATMPGNDVSQIHRYLDLGARLKVCQGPVDVLAADAVRELLAARPGRPVMLAESGAVEPSHSGPFKLYAADKQGAILHDVLFGAFFAGAAGAGQCWHWDHYVNKNDLWWQFGRFANTVKDLDPPAEGFEPVMVEHPRLRVYLLKGKSTLLLWARDVQNDWKSELADGKAPDKLRGLSINLAAHLKGFEAGKVRIYAPWADQWSDGKLDSGAVALPEFERSIVVKIQR